MSFGKLANHSKLSSSSIDTTTQIENAQNQNNNLNHNVNDNDAQKIVGGADKNQCKTTLNQLPNFAVVSHFIKVFAKPLHLEHLTQELFRSCLVHSFDRGELDSLLFRLMKTGYKTVSRDFDPQLRSYVRKFLNRGVLDESDERDAHIIEQLDELLEGETRSVFHHSCVCCKLVLLRELCEDCANSSVLRRFIDNIKDEDELLALREFPIVADDEHTNTFVYHVDQPDKSLSTTIFKEVFRDDGSRAPSLVEWQTLCTTADEVRSLITQLDADIEKGDAADKSLVWRRDLRDELNEAIVPLLDEEAKRQAAKERSRQRVAKQLGGVRILDGKRKRKPIQLQSATSFIDDENDEEFGRGRRRRTTQQQVEPPRRKSRAERAAARQNSITRQQQQQQQQQPMQPGLPHQQSFSMPAPSAPAGTQTITPPNTTTPTPNPTAPASTYQFSSF